MCAQQTPHIANVHHANNFFPNIKVDFTADLKVDFSKIKVDFSDIKKLILPTLKLILPTLKLIFPTLKSWFYQL